MSVWIPLVVALLSILLFVLFSRRDEKRVNRDWDELLEQEQVPVVDLVQRQMGTHLQVLDFNFGMADELRRLKNVDEAIRLLSVGYQAIGSFVPNLTMLLTVMARFSRMVAAITPLDPLDPSEYKTGSNASLAHLHRWLNHLVRTTREGFRLRLFILGKGVSMTSTHLFRSLRRVILHRSLDEREWEEIEAMRHDMGQLTLESMTSFRWMMEAISAQSQHRLTRELLKPPGSTER